VSQLLLRLISADVPVGTRGIDILMTATRTAGSYNDGYADNLALQLIGTQQVELPNPGTLGLLGLALVGLGFSRKRARK
jgi:PEP-CTERM motif-containing protein